MGSNQKTPHIVVYMYVAVFSPKIPNIFPSWSFSYHPSRKSSDPLVGYGYSGLSHVNDYQMFKINQSELYRKTRVKLDEKSALDWQ